jgi:glycosyltransferase involved in cell wall biosynthesis
MQTEIEAVSPRFDLKLVSLLPARVPFRRHLPFTVSAEPAELAGLIEDFRPDVLHTHWMDNAELLVVLAEKTGVPFTLRAHSFDTLGEKTRRRLRGLWKTVEVPEGLERAVRAVRNESCLGVITLPCSEQRLVRLGVPAAKLFPAPPVVNVGRFLDRGPNGDGVINTGPCLPKKQMKDFIDVAASVPGRTFRLYPVGHRVEEIRARNEQSGSPVTVVPPVEPVDMPPEYKKAEWLLYTASPKLKTVGWPVSIAEAQASGVGVIMRNLRPDLRTYVGDAGFLYDSLDEARRIVERPFPPELREQGFELAKQWDVNTHIHVLTDLWPTMP